MQYRLWHAGEPLPAGAAPVLRRGGGDPLSAILAIDTCLSQCGAALLREDGAVFARRENLGIGHAERIAPMVAELFEEAGLAPAALSRVAATVGPGSFMGSRVGISLAKGLALPRRVPTVPITTLEAIALGRPRPLCVLIDARRGQAYAQFFERKAQAPALLSHEDAAALASQADAVAGVGLSEILGGAAAEDRMPDPAAIAAHAATAPTGPLRPFYLRAPDAKAPARAPL